jgi:hypothetical protein
LGSLFEQYLRPTRHRLQNLVWGPVLFARQGKDDDETYENQDEENEDAPFHRSPDENSRTPAIFRRRGIIFALFKSHYREGIKDSQIRYLP